MGNWKYVRSITAKNIKMILFSPRFYIVLISVFACLYIFGDKLSEYLLTENSKMGFFELLPVLLNSRLTQLYIPFQVNHLHGQTEPVPRRVRATLTETEPMLFYANYQATAC